MSTKETTEIMKFLHALDKKVAVGFAEMDIHGKEMIKHQKETNGRVKQLEKDVVRLDETIDDKHWKTRKHLYWVIGIVFAIGSFLWIQESREFIIALLFKII